MGGTNYIGDIGSESYINPNEIGFGVIYKYNLNPRIALRGTYSYLPLYANDENSKNTYRNNRGFSFSNVVHELAGGIEFNFFDYNIREYSTSFTPYILAELALINYKNVSNYIDSDNITYNDTSSYVIPVGLGVKGRLTDNLAYGVEIAARFTFTDDLDYTTPEISDLDFAGYGNDHYIFTGVSLVYTFGRPPCYAPRE